MFIGVSEANAILKGEKTLATVLKESVAAYKQLPKSLAKLITKTGSKLKTKVIKGVSGLSLMYQLNTAEIKLGTIINQGGKAIVKIEVPMTKGTVLETIEECLYLNADNVVSKATIEVVEDGGKVGLGVNRAGNTAEALKARELLSKLKLIEPQVTDDLVGLANKNAGKMEGLDFRLKSEESLTRKLQSEGINTLMNDVLRYTTTFDDATFVKGIENTLNDLKNKGYEVVKLKNTFTDGSMYKGININMKTPSGEIFELQFHTPSSFNMKQNINHTLYEEFRLLDKTTARAKELEQIMISNSNSVVNPPNVQSIK